MTHSNARFTLDDFDTAMLKDQLTVKKEKNSSSLPPKRSTNDLIVKTPGPQKRKIVESIGLYLENLGAEEVLQKLVSFSQAIGVGFILVSQKA